MRALRPAFVLCPAITLLSAPVGAVPVQGVSNLGLSAASTYDHGQAQRDHILFHVREDGQDQNGDGDGNDTIAYVLSTPTGLVRSTGVAVAVHFNLEPMLGDRLCVLPAREASYGPSGTDLNGDGDVNDEVAHVYDLASGAVTNLRVAFAAIDAPTAGDHVLIRVPEGAQGADLNGDGDLTDFIVHTWHVGQQAAVNRGLAIAYSVIGRRGALFMVPEFLQGVDLNGDGDTGDSVVHAYDRAADSITNLGIPSLRLAPDRDGNGDVFAFAAFEAAQGAGADWNGDGDSNDLVLHAWIAPSATLRNLGFPVRAQFDDSAFVEIVGSRIFFGANEAYAGSGADWNGDGDANDLVLHVHEVRSATTRNAGLALAQNSAGFDHPPIDGATIAFIVPEADQGGADRNGDGDAADFVPALYDARTGITTNLAIASRMTFAASMSRRLLAFQADESAQGAQDLNGDGRLTPVAAAYERATGTLRVLPVPVAYQGPFALRDTVAFLAPENLSVADLNGDGDQLDDVFHTWEWSTGAVTNHALAVEEGFLGVARDGLVFRVRELVQAHELERRCGRDGPRAALLPPLKLDLTNHEAVDLPRPRRFVFGDPSRCPDPRLAIERDPRVEGRAVGRPRTTAASAPGFHDRALEAGNPANVSG